MLASQLLRRVVELAGYKLHYPTPESKLGSLLQSLWPVECGRPLIRLGGDGDGGYVVPDDLDGIKYCFSPGVSKIADFENDLARRGITSFLADWSVDGPPAGEFQFTFDKKFLGCLEDERYMTLHTWKDKYIPDFDGDLILQMDIEGGEFEVILNMPTALLRQFRVLVVEFHDLDMLSQRFAFDVISRCFEKLLKDFVVVHSHPNNYLPVDRFGRFELPPLIEMTFYNRRRCVVGPVRTTFPHPLDRCNVPSKPPVPLPKCWYAPGR